jgi:tetratricopeptide (TPR) repeat protein
MCRRSFFFWPLLGGIITMYSCKNSDSALGRAWHNTTAHYNMYFNAEQKWNETVLTLRENNKDDYRTFIELYNYGPAESLKGNQAVMDEVVKKVSTMIDKHPRSRWVDDAYLLMGKAYFIKGDFIAAEDLFNFVHTNYKDPIIQYRAKLWIYQTLYQRKKYGEAENLARSLYQDKDFPKSLRGELYKALATVYIKEGKMLQAYEYLSKALPFAKGKMERYRLHFSLAQVCVELKKQSEAATHFEKVIKINPPYEMAFNARIQLAQMVADQGGRYAKVNSILKKMLKDDKNIEYYGQIHYRMGMNELRAGNEEKALFQFNQSLRKSGNDNAQMTTTYLAVGDYYYQKRSYENAGLYYDSANRKLDEKHPDFQRLSQKSAQLTDLLRHLLTIKREDSLLRMAADPVFREKTIDNLIENEKKQAERMKNQPVAPPPPAPSATGTETMSGSSSFPFYNAAMKAKSAQEFQTYWGNRVNRDYWRISSKKIAVPNPSTTSDSGVKEDNEPMQDIPEGISADRRKYYKDIPFSADAKKNARQRLEEAMFAAAGIYQNQLLEEKEAIRLYELLLKTFPKTQYEAQVYFEMAKIHRAAGRQNDFNSYRQLLKEKFPNSVYLKLLDGKENTGGNTEQVSELRVVEELYEKMYALFKDGKFNEAISVKMEADRKYAGNAYQSRFDYLYGICLLKTDKQDKGIDILKQIIQDFPSTPVATQAQATLEAWERLKANASDSSEDGKKADSTASETQIWKTWDGKEELFYLLVFPKGSNTNMIRAALNDFNKENFIFEKLEVSPARASGSTIYISVSNFSKSEITKEYLAFIQKKPEILAAKGLFEFEMAWISKTNYLTLASNNRINAYMEFFRGKLR